MDRLRRVRTIADYQFGKGAGDALFPDNVRFLLSSTGRIRQIFDNGRIATLRAKDGLLTLSIAGASKLHAFFRYPRLRVVVMKEAAEHVAGGKSVFAKHVVGCDPQIRAGDEILVVDPDDRLLATGKAVLSAEEMRAFTSGVAVRVREGKVY
jgi:uncharacterized protein with predicted RNA binding PUA domain